MEAVIPYFWTKITSITYIHCMNSHFFNCRRLTLLFMLAGSATLATAQQNQPTSIYKNKKDKQAERRERVNKLIRQEEEGALIFEKHWALGARIYSDGWGAFFEKGKMKSVDVTNLYSLEIGHRRHPKEEKLNTISSGSIFFGTPFIYAKQNNFLFAKLGVGQNRLLGGKGNKNGVAVSALYQAGFSGGFLKPYYLDVVDPRDGEAKTIKYTGDGSRADTLFLDYGSNPASAGFFKGFGDMTFVPGVFLRGGVRFDYGRYNELISAVECGFNVEYYTKPMPIMVALEPRKAFLNVYAAIVFGRRK
ncbi:MAG TPA: hypothetical protein PKD90_15765 [Phnomibacter sp.]|nr:hypothetical protein [Phnomibacter sp.]